MVDLNYITGLRYGYFLAITATYIQTIRFVFL